MVGPMQRAGGAVALAVITALGGCAPDGLPTAPSDLAPRFAAGDIVTVMNANDDGAGSLRAAVAAATGGEIIRFDPSLAGQTIELASMIEIEVSVTIEGPAAGVTLSGGNQVRVLDIFEGSAGNPTRVTLRNLTITGGEALSGGGIQSGGWLTVENSTITGNHAAATGGGGGGVGGGIEASHLTLINSTVSGNSADVRGGGVSVALDLVVISSTITGNTAGSGGGIGNDHSCCTTEVTLRNSIVAGNTASMGANCATTDGITHVGSNISDDASCGASGDVIIADPLLGELADNGGPNFTHAPLQGSPAIDAATSCNVSVDQRYVARPIGASCDVGAVEFDDYLTLVIDPDPSGTVNPNSGVAIVSGTLVCSDPVSVELRVTVSQKQKAKRVNTTVHATDAVVVSCEGTKAWSIALTAQSGGFTSGSAEISVQTADNDPWVMPAQAADVVRLFFAKVQ